VNREQKKKEVAILKDMLTRARHLIVSDHSGINVADISLLRRKLKEGNSEIRVSKNTLFKMALAETELAVLQRHFEGPTSVVFGYDDPAVPAKIIYDSIKEIEKPKFKSYFYDGAEHDFDFLKRIAELPPRDIVVAMLVVTVQGPISNLVGLLDSAAREFVGTLEALVKSKGD
jgi:large subunit ribosomal protein L10